MWDPLTWDSTTGPKEYGETISAYAQETSEDVLYPGVYYSALAWFLEDAISLDAPTSAKHVVLHDLSYDHGDDRRVVYFENSEAGSQAFANYPFPTADSGHLMFMRGLSSPAWIKLIGAKYNLSPEVFRRHLPTLFSQDLRLPSLSSEVFSIDLTTFASLMTVADSRKLSESMPTMLQDYAKDLWVYGSRRRFGDSVIRNALVLENVSIALEQTLTLSVTRGKNAGWIALIVMDIGEEFPEPLTRVMNNFWRVVQHAPQTWLRDSTLKKFPSDSSPTTRFTRKQAGSALCHKSYGRFLDERVRRSDPYYAISDIINFYIAAEYGLYDALRDMLEDFVGNGDVEDGVSATNRLSKELTLLIKYNNMIKLHVERVASLKSNLVERGCASWHVNNHQLPKPDPKVQEMDNYLLQIHKKLYQDWISLSGRYREVMEQLQHSAMMNESKQAVAQAQGVMRLTTLAFFFIPLSFTTSFFGMNFREIDNDLSIRVWFYVSVPILLASVLLCWSTISAPLYNTMRRLKTHSQKRRLERRFGRRFSDIGLESR